MNPLSQIGILTVQTLGDLYLLIVLLRFLLQVARADFYNPLSQFIVKATNPLLLPLRRVIPGLFGIDIAGIVLGLCVQFVIFFLVLLFSGHVANPLLLLIASALNLVAMAIQIYFFCLIVMIITSFVAPYTRHPFVMLSIQLLRPVSAPFQKILPPMGGFDLSPILIILAMKIVRILVMTAAQATGTAPLINDVLGGFL
ncbi:MAG TPA: YggT family protein [Pseudomonadales bacterium]|nr:YggT family protein [Pseudomonadales bacterium]